MKNLPAKGPSWAVLLSLRSNPLRNPSFFEGLQDDTSIFLELQFSQDNCSFNFSKSTIQIHPPNKNATNNLNIVINPFDCLKDLLF